MSITGNTTRPRTKPIRVVYLLGAGATHACVQKAGIPHGVLMSDLAKLMHPKVRDIVTSRYSRDSGLVNMANTVIHPTTDYEQLITFLSDSPSMVHRQFADDLRIAFEAALRHRLEEVIAYTGQNPTGLYEALFDMYNIGNVGEVLHGILTTNYDTYIEEAWQAIRGSDPNFGLVLEDVTAWGGSQKVIKLHGSLNWQATWPTSVSL